MQADKNPQILKSAIREATLLQHCKGHPHIVELHEAYRSDSGKVYLVMEYVPNVLSSIISDHTSTGAGLPPKLIWQYLKQLLLGVRHLHTNKIMHRDLKPANIMVTEGGTVKIIDLGLSRQCMPFKNVLTAYVQTRWYRAPELLVPGAPYSFEVDIWAVGCIAAEMITGKPLFPGRSHEDQLQVIMNCFGALPKRYMGDILGLETRDHKPVRPPKNGEATGLPGMLGPFTVQRDLLDFISACLTMDPLMRPSADHLLLHHMPDTKPARLQGAVQAGLGAGAVSACSTPFANCAQHVQPTILSQSMAPIQVQHKQRGIHALSRFSSLAHDCMNSQPSPPASCFILSDNAVFCATEHEHYGPKRVSVKDFASLSNCLVTSHNRLQAVMHSDVSTEAVAVVDRQCQKEALMEGNIALGSKLPLISAAMPARQLVKKMGSSDDSSEEQSLPHLHGGSILCCQQGLLLHSCLKLPYRSIISLFSTLLSINRLVWGI
ncbi:hypothetical protein CEUSTIGMA_g13174.t1 [Chlamydomonas eustigma]|uniref:Protein kinase domain-containing protein n=1 Tax=Chlamydomonas eustigma TaxID=1157962 RepID=A0A250XS39_9CHLO|nr:hypothetical protein CEUSTIGMA_g13174.t1 [Chlamydomonas eustigma]|eukprot:GAX85759.1 hypothetical protein CEUSTIGMA_g13174.t1 [Chlamydomonas eustigma]